MEQTYFFLPLLKLVSKILCHVFILKKICLYSTYSSFLVIYVCNKGKTLCSPCITPLIYATFSLSLIAVFQFLIIYSAKPGQRSVLLTYLHTASPRAGHQSSYEHTMLLFLHSGGKL